MKRKLYAIVIASIILGAGAVVATGSVNDIEYPFTFPFVKEKRNIQATSGVEDAEHAIEVTNEITSIVELKEPSKLFPTTLASPDEEKFAYQTVVGQWGYMNNPQSQGDFLGTYDGSMIKGSSTDIEGTTTKYTIDLERGSFTGEILVEQSPSISPNVDNSQSLAIIPIYSTYSISNEYITMFWSKGIEKPILSSADSIVYDGWFFGELL